MQCDCGTSTSAVARQRWPKRIETELGLSRSGETTGLSGFDAVRLWYQYKRGSQAALDKLVRYNSEDIQNLGTIIGMLYLSLMENAYQQVGQHYIVYA